jgi:heat shock protein HslJ
MTVSLVGAIACASSGASLDGTQWRLTGWSLGSQRPSDFAISAKFADGKISGRGGVNSFGGSYTIGPGDAFATGPLASTRMAGPGPAMRAESGFPQRLGQARSYRRSDGKLTLYDSDGNELLSFAAAKP